MARAQRFPRNLLPILAGVLFVLVGAGLLYTAFHKGDAVEEKPFEAPVQPGRAENITARARAQADPTGAETAPVLPASPGMALPHPVPGADYRMPDGSASTLPATPAADVDAYAQRKEEARSATASLAAYEEFDTATRAAPSPQGDTLAALEKALAGSVQPVSAGADTTADLLQRAMQAAQGAQGGSAVTAKTQNAWSRDQRAVADVEPPLTATAASSPWMLFQGTVIPAVLVTPVTSDAPGSLTARVTRDVYDDVRARRLLIPKGSRLYGAYMSEVGEGQERLLMAFSRVIFPDGQSVRLSGFSGADAMGRSGLPANVNTHFWKMFGTGFLIAGIAKVFDRASSGQNITVINQAGGSTTLTDSAGQILTETARRVLEKNQNISPTLSLPEGFKFNVIVNRDMALAPYVPGWRESAAGYARNILSRGKTSAAMTKPTIHLMTSNSRSILSMSDLVARFSAESASAALRAASSGTPMERKASYTSEIIMAMSKPRLFVSPGRFYA